MLDHALEGIDGNVSGVLQMSFKAAVIGLGVGEKHAEAMRAHPDCDLVGICDTDPQKLKEVSGRFPGVPTTTCAEDLLDDPTIDLVSIASYDEYHASQMMLGLERNKHLFVEKPICLKLEQAQTIARLMEERPHLKIGSNLILRKYPLFLQLKRWVEEGRFGEVYAIEADYNYGRLHKVIDGWRSRTQDYSITLSGGVHMVDLLIWILGGRPQKVYAHANKVCSRGTPLQAPDFITALLDWGEVRVKLGMNFGCVQPHHHHVKIFGTKATFIHDVTGTVIIDSRDPKTPFENITIAYPGCHKGDLLGDFIDASIHGREPTPSRKEILDGLAVCLAVDNSASKRQSLDIPYLIP